MHSVSLASEKITFFSFYHLHSDYFRIKSRNVQLLLRITKNFQILLALLSFLILTTNHTTAW